MFNIKSIAAAALAGGFMMAATAHAHVVQDQGLVRIIAVKSVCIDKYNCEELSIFPAMHAALTLERIFEQSVPHGQREADATRPIDAPSTILKTPVRGTKPDDGPPVY